MKYGAFKFNSYNIGDEIQSIAAQRFLPQIDYYIFKEQIKHFKCEEKVKVIMNSWYMFKPRNWPPNECIEPLLISMYFNPDCREAVLTKEGIAFFLKYGPVGCRDLSTLKWLEENDIPAYHSSCLTSCLIPNQHLREKYPHNYILCVDCPDSVVKYVKQNTDRPVYSFSKHFSPFVESIDRLDLAKAVLFMYQNAHCVVTTNLHTALPCVAFGVNVCILHKKQEVSFGIGRFEGMEDFYNWETEEGFLDGGYDFNNPPENPKAFEKYRDSLIEKCREFTGYDSQKPTLEDDFEPLHTVLNMISGPDYKYNNSKRVLYYVGKRELLKMLIIKAFTNADRHDIDSDQYLQLSEIFRIKPHKNEVR